MADLERRIDHRNASPHIGAGYFGNSRRSQRTPIIENAHHGVAPPMTGNTTKLFRVLIVSSLIDLISLGAKAEPDQVTCTGILSEAETRTSAWPLKVIQDADTHHFCTIDRTASGHDLFKACSLGDKCRVIGTFRKVGPTYSILRVISVTRAE